MSQSNHERLVFMRCLGVLLTLAALMVFAGGVVSIVFGARVFNEAPEIDAENYFVTVPGSCVPVSQTHEAHSSTTTNSDGKVKHSCYDKYTYHVNATIEPEVNVLTNLKTETFSQKRTAGAICELSQKGTPPLKIGERVKCWMKKVPDVPRVFNCPNTHCVKLKDPEDEVTMIVVGGILLTLLGIVLIVGSIVVPCTYPDRFSWDCEANGCRYGRSARPVLRKVHAGS
jgi:hypothetical protein